MSQKSSSWLGYWRQAADEWLTRQSFYPWLVWGLGATFFFAQYFARLAPSVAEPDLMRAFHVDALGIGSLSAVFYYSYLAMQVPAGALMDRFGAHRLLMVMVSLCAAACFLFGHAHSLWQAQFARIVMGFAAAFSFVGALKLATVWFPANRLGFLAGATQATGMLGAAIGEGPVEMGMEHLGWRPTMIIMGGVILGLAALIGLLVRDHPHEEVQKNTRLASAQEIWDGLKQVVKNPRTWWCALYTGFIFAPTGAFAEFWGVTYLSNTHEMSQAVAASGISAIFLGWGVGGPITGWLSDYWKKRKPVLYLSAVASLALLSVVLYMPGLSAWEMLLALFLYGVANTGLGVAYAVAGEVNSKSLTGIALSFTNIMTVIVGALLQPLIGWFLVMQWDGRSAGGVHVYSETAYHHAMLVLPVMLVLAFIMAFKVQETHCRNVVDEA